MGEEEWSMGAGRDPAMLRGRRPRTYRAASRAMASRRGWIGETCRPGDQGEGQLMIRTCPSVAPFSRTAWVKCFPEPPEGRLYDREKSDQDQD